MKHKLLPACIAASLGTLGPVTVSFAEEAMIEEVMVTGSRIKRKDVDGLGKVDVLTAADFDRIGAVSVDQLLKYSPFTAGASAGSQSNYLSSKEGYGTASVNLRGLGQNRTLVLVNGRRFVAGGSGANSVVDLNSIPVNMIDRVETLLDGSSAVYGADAVAGVVNLITKRSFDGVQIDGSFGQTFESDAENSDISILFGQESEDKGFVISLNYTDRKEARSKDRDFSNCFIEEEEGDKFCSGSSYSVGGRGQTADGRFQFNQDPNGDGDAFEPWRFQDHAFDFQEYFVLSAPYERINISANGFYDLGDNLRLYTENTYTNRESNTEASPASIRPAFSATYLHNPTGLEISQLRRRMIDEGFGARIWEQEVSLFRSVIGLEGEFNNGWSWDASLNYGKSESDEKFTNAIDLVRLAETINEDDCADPTATTCVDWFGINGPTPEALALINATVPTVGENTQFSFLATVTGDLFEIANGPVGFAAGIEYRKDEGKYSKKFVPDHSDVHAVPHTVTDTHDIRSGGGGSGAPIDADLSSTEVYAEATLPMSENLDLNIAARFSDYSDFDSEFTYKIGGDWRITDSFRVRSTFSTAVRTPNIRELYTTEEVNFTTFVDPCNQWESNGNANLMANCAVAVGSGFEQGDVFIEVDYPGNQDLNPETADTFTLGLVYEPEQVEGLTLTVDYYKIEIEDSIRNVSPSAGLEQCYYSENLSYPTCNDVLRDGFGGDVFFMTVPLLNAAREELSGMDFGLQYQFEAMGSQFSIKWDTAYLDTFEIEYEGAPSSQKLAGTISNGEGGNGSYTEWRSNLLLAMDRDAWGTSYNINYIGDAESQFQPNGATAPSVPSVTYHNLEGYLHISEGLVVRAGINNLYDKQPPYYTNPIDQNTDPFTYDLLGRRFFVKATYNF